MLVSLATIGQDGTSSTVRALPIPTGSFTITRGRAYRSFGGIAPTNGYSRETNNPNYCALFLHSGFVQCVPRLNTKHQLGCQAHHNSQRVSPPEDKPVQRLDVLLENYEAHDRERWVGRPILSSSVDRRALSTKQGFASPKTRVQNKKSPNLR